MHSRAREQKEEFSLIGRFAASVASTIPKGTIGIGDDCAVIPRADASYEVVTTDVLLEGTHFRRLHGSPQDIGWRSIAVSLSDIAAMGALPKYAVVGLLVPEDVSASFLEAMYQGIEDIALKFGVSVVGGDTVASADLGIAITLVGESDGKPVLRSEAQAGDDVWVSGAIGLAGAGLRALDAGETDVATEQRKRFLRPIPRVALGSWLREKGIASSMIDVSDGLLQDAEHIASASNLDLCLQLGEIPTGSSPGLVSEQQVLEACVAGDDYELLFTASEEHRERIATSTTEFECQVTRIGKVSSVHDRGGQLWVYGAETDDLLSARELLEKYGMTRLGYNHFDG